jgi:hypothetical protein
MNNVYLICLGQFKHAKMQSLQDPNQDHVDNLNNARREASRHLRNNEREYVKVKNKKLETN